MYGYIYKTTNLINNKIYIGKHKSSKFNPKYKGSGKLLKKAIKKYGYNNFETILICECENLKELNEKEKYYIEKLDSLYINNRGYNITLGGDGGATTTNTIVVHKENSCKFIYLNELNFYLENGYEKGMSDKMKINLKNNTYYRSKTNNPFYGKHHSEITKKLISMSSKGRGAGDNNVAKRLDVRKKISEKAKGENNYFKNHKFIYINDGKIELKIENDKTVPFGFVKGRLPSCWVHNREIEKLVLIKDLNYYLDNGFIKGRLPKV